MDVKQHRLRVSDNHKKEEVIGSWRKVRNEKVLMHSIKCYYGDEIKKDQMSETYSMYGRREMCIHSWCEA
jgi:hypothetical protein